MVEGRVRGECLRPGLAERAVGAVGSTTPEQDNPERAVGVAGSTTPEQDNPERAVKVVGSTTPEQDNSERAARVVGSKTHKKTINILNVYCIDELINYAEL